MQLKEFLLTIIKARTVRTSLTTSRISLTTLRGAELANGDDDAPAPPQAGNTKYFFEIMPRKSKFTPPPPDSEHPAKKKAKKSQGGKKVTNDDDCAAKPLCCEAIDPLLLRACAAPFSQKSLLNQ